MKYADEQDDTPTEIPPTRSLLTIARLVAWLRAAHLWPKPHHENDDHPEDEKK